ncbi:response regulator transcription factor [Amycolatopsis sp. Hca4]|uniref:helix-turn-helix transcriptional regulator n=1 Tax=Amycolatopsis sp. Hca4 TaxID=2742131 RepID=UPI0015904C74|nr:response regulator transcription factor [Amycolatopsis sp. Hca4]QKV74645.1 response regulator transcription factor [Amycolatopsis sp. Hca4]
MAFEREHRTAGPETEVLLAEQWPLNRAETRRKLEQDPALRVSAEVESLVSLRGVVRAVSPSAVVVAVDLLGSGDEAALAELAVPVLLIGEQDDGDRVARLLSPRVRGFVCRSDGAPELAGAVRAVAAGHASLPPAVAGKLLDTLVRNPPRPAVFDQLTQREQDVLQYISQGLTTAEIAAEMVVQTSTIKSHIYHLLQKLRVRDRTQAVALAYRSGIVHVPAPRFADRGDVPLPSV